MAGEHYGSLRIDTMTDIVTKLGNFPGKGKWRGGILALNGAIYGIPFDSAQVLRIDPKTDNLKTFGNTSFDRQKWIGGAVARSGIIYGIPYDSAKILKIGVSVCVPPAL